MSVKEELKEEIREEENKEAEILEAADEATELIEDETTEMIEDETTEVIEDETTEVIDDESTEVIDGEETEETEEDPAEETEDETTELIDDESTEVIDGEETEETEEDPAEEEAVEETEEPAERELKASTIAKREKKKARREDKAARKAANLIEEKKSRPNNLLLAILIVGVILLMFGGVKGYNYFSKPASIEKYIEENGGEEAFGSMMMDMYTNAAISADGNSMKIDVVADVDGDLKDDLLEYYKSEEGQKQLKYWGAYFLGNLKPMVRGFSGDVTINTKIGDTELEPITLTYKEARDILENGFDDPDEAEDVDETGEAEEGEAGEGETEEGGAEGSE